MNVNNGSTERFRSGAGSIASAVRGPVLLIVLGSLFAVEYNGGPQFSRTWPLLLVAFGLMRLFEYLGAKTDSAGGRHQI